MRFPLFGSCVLMSALLILAGCGGGGGGGNEEGGGIGQGVNERPHILATSPSNGAQDVVSNELIEIVFRDRVDPASIDPQQIVVRSSAGAVTGLVDYVETTRRMYFFPDAPLAAGLRTTVTVKAGLRDLSGNERFEDFTFRFDVAAAGVGQPDAGEYTPDPARVAQMAANETGDGFLLYLRNETATDRALRARRVVSGTALVGDTELSLGTNIAVNQVNGLAVSQSGDAVVAWTQKSAANDVAFMRYYDAQAGNWRPAETLENLVGWDALQVSVVMDDNGSALLAWRRRMGSSLSDMRVAQYSRTQGLSPIQTLSGPSGELAVPALNGSRNGRAILTWSKKNASDDFDAIASIYDPFNGGWGAAQILDDYAPGHALRAEGFIDEDGYGVVAWEQWTTDGSNKSTLWGSRFRPGLGYDQPLQLDGVADRYRSIVGHVDGNGTGHLVFNRDESNDAGIIVYPWTRAGGWQASVELHEGTPGNIGYTTLRIAGGVNGEVVVGWTQTGREGVPGGWATVSQRAANGTWSPPRYVGETGISAYPPMRLALLPDGRLSTTWVQRMDVADIHDRVRTRVVDPDGSMDAGRTLSLDDGRFMTNLFVVMGPSSFGQAAWTQFTAGGVESDVWTNRQP